MVVIPPNWKTKTVPESVWQMDQESNLAKCKTWSWAKVSYANVSAYHSLLQDVHLYSSSIYQGFYNNNKILHTLIHFVVGGEICVITFHLLWLNLTRLNKYYQPYPKVKLKGSEYINPLPIGLDLMVWWRKIMVHVFYSSWALGEERVMTTNFHSLRWCLDIKCKNLFILLYCTMWCIPPVVSLSPFTSLQVIGLVLSLLTSKRPVPHLLSISPSCHEPILLLLHLHLLLIFLLHFLLLPF